MICNFPLLFSYSKNIRMWTLISTSNHMFKRQIWDKFTELTFLKFWNFPSKARENSKFQKMNEVNFPQISRINMWFLVNHMLQALTCFTWEISKFQKVNSINLSQISLLNMWLIVLIVNEIKKIRDITIYRFIFAFYVVNIVLCFSYHHYNLRT